MSESLTQFFGRAELGLADGRKRRSEDLLQSGHRGHREGVVMARSSSTRQHSVLLYRSAERTVDDRAQEDVARSWASFQDKQQ